MTKDEVIKVSLDLFLQEYLTTPGPGFYLEDAYTLYRGWALNRGMANVTILGRSRFAWHLEGMGYERVSRRGIAFFKGATLKGGRVVRYTYPK